jgi:hypothetical protein
MGVAFAPSNPNRVYVTTGNWSQAESGAGPTQRGFRGFYRSDDGGATFQTMSPANAGGDTVWTSKIWVDPVNPDRLFVAGVSLRSSADGGATWANVNNLHADHHAMAWDPTAPGRAFEGNDGGFYSSAGNGASGTWTEALNEPWTQFYSVDVSEQDPARVVGGAQDNGCLRSWDSAGAVTGAWGSYGGCGDGLYTVIDPSNQNNVYACSQFGVCARSVNAGNNSTRFSDATASDRRNWQTPVVLDPTTPSTVYYGGNLLNRSVDLAPASSRHMWCSVRRRRVAGRYCSAVADMAEFARLVGRDSGLCVVSTLRADATIHSSVVNAGVLQHPVRDVPVVGLVAMGGSRKVVHLRARSRATVVVRAGWEWVAVEGRVDLAGPEDPMVGIDAQALRSLLRAVFVAAGGSHDDWDTYDRVMAQERRTAVLITPDRIYANR